jgi:hypothetical protein
MGQIKEVKEALKKVNWSPPIMLGDGTWIPARPPRSIIVTVDRVPDWLSSGDLIENRGKRTFAVSLTQTEPRWRSLLNRLSRWISSL